MKRTIFVILFIIAACTIKAQTVKFYDSSLGGYRIVGTTTCVVGGQAFGPLPSAATFSGTITVAPDTSNLWVLLELQASLLGLISNTDTLATIAALDRAINTNGITANTQLSAIKSIDSTAVANMITAVIGNAIHTAIDSLISKSISDTTGNYLRLVIATNTGIVHSDTTGNYLRSVIATNTGNGSTSSQMITLTSYLAPVSVPYTLQDTMSYSRVDSISLSTVFSGKTFWGGYIQCTNASDSIAYCYSNTFSGTTLTYVYGTSPLTPIAPVLLTAESKLYIKSIAAAASIQKFQFVLGGH